MQRLNLFPFDIIAGQTERSTSYYTPITDDQQAIQIYNDTITLMKSDSLFSLSPDSQQMITQIQHLPQSDYITIIKFVSSKKTVHSITNPSLLPNHIYFHFERFITKSLGKLHQHNTDSSIQLDSVLQSNDTLEGIYYVGGFILRKLKKMTGWTNEELEQLTLWSIPSETGVPSTWNDLISRGGLLDISSDLFQLLKLMDKIATAYLNNINRNCNLTQIIMKCILQQPEIISMTCRTSTDLIYAIAEFFTRVRCKAFVKGKVNYLSTSLRQNLMGLHGAS